MKYTTEAPPDQERRLVMAMHYVQEHGSITNRQYREYIRVLEPIASHDLLLLVTRGLLKSNGKTRARHYTLP